jgi:hypothetical protein
MMTLIFKQDLLAVISETLFRLQPISRLDFSIAARSKPRSISALARGFTRL